MKDKYDKCVCCNKNTQEPQDKHIDYRNYYVEGAGQLCENCYIQLYGNYSFGSILIF